MAPGHVPPSAPTGVRATPPGAHASAVFYEGPIVSAEGEILARCTVDESGPWIACYFREVYEQLQRRPATPYEVDQLRCLERALNARHRAGADLGTVDVRETIARSFRLLSALRAQA